MPYVSRHLELAKLDLYLLASFLWLRFFLEFFVVVGVYLFWGYLEFCLFVCFAFVLFGLVWFGCL